MEELVNVIFNGTDFDLIMKYMESTETETVQEAILKAIHVAMAIGDET